MLLEEIHVVAIVGRETHRWGKESQTDISGPTAIFQQHLSAALSHLSISYRLDVGALRHQSHPTYLSPLCCFGNHSAKQSTGFGIFTWVEAMQHWISQFLRSSIRPVTQLTNKMDNSPLSILQAPWASPWRRHPTRRCCSKLPTLSHSLLPLI